MTTVAATGRLSLTIDTRLGGRVTPALVDTGATVSLLSTEFVSKMGLRVDDQAPRHAFTTANGEPLVQTGWCETAFDVGAVPEAVRWRFAVIKGLAADIIIGCDLLRHVDAVVDLTARIVCIKGVPVQASLLDAGGAPAFSIYSRELLDAVFALNALDASPVADQGGLDAWSEEDGVWCPPSPSEVDPTASDLAKHVAETSPHLSEAQRTVLLEAMPTEVFASVAWRPVGQSSVTPHTIDVGNAAPVAVPLRRTNPAQTQAIDKTVQEMLKMGVIRASRSPWAAAIVPVTKKDQSIRICIDFRRLNAVTKKDVFPLPRIDEMLDSLAGALWFTTLDLASGYWQVPLEERDKEKTAFRTRDNQYEFNVLPFGLCNAPATFQRALNGVLAPYRRFCRVYIDDIVIFSRTFEEHVAHVKVVMAALRQANLLLKLAKCKFAQRRVAFLGHVIAEGCVETDPEKVRVMQDFPAPRNVAELRRFLGLAGYYQRFIPRYPYIAEPLLELQRGHTPFVWDERRHGAFLALKRALCENTVLQLPDMDRPFVVRTDASDTGIAGVLLQDDRPISYFGRTLSSAERNYSTTELEGLAVAEACDKFAPYLSVGVTIETDHQALLALSGKEMSTARLARLALRLSHLSPTFRYRPGSVNVDADALSRAAVAAPAAPVVGVMPLSDPLHDREALKRVIAGSIEEDPFFGPIARALRPGATDSAVVPLTIDHYVWRDELLWAIDEEHAGTPKATPREPGHDRICVGVAARPNVLSACHDSPFAGHLGIHRTYARVRADYFWPNMRRDVEQFLRSCRECNARKDGPHGNAGLLKSIPVGGPGQLVAMDFLGPLPESNRGNKYILVFADHFTKWPEAYACTAANANNVLVALVDYVSRHGIPDKLLSDRGSHFTAAAIDAVAVPLGIKRLLTSAYHPQTDGTVERFNRTLCEMLSAYVSAKQKDWDTWLPYCLFAYRTSVHASTKQTPYFLEHGRDAVFPSLATVPREEALAPAEFAQSLLGQLRKATLQASRAITVAQEHMKQEYDKRHRDKEYEVGDAVWLFTPRRPRGLTHKLLAQWRGPFRITRKFDALLYELQARNGVRLNQRINIRRLKPYVARPTLLTPKDVPELVSDDEFDPDEEDMGAADSQEGGVMVAKL